MAAESGRTFVLKHGDGASPEVFTAIAECREDTLRINGELVDVSDKSTNFRQLLSGGGLLSVSITTTGTYKGGTQAVALEALSRSQALNNFELDYGSFGTYSGAFQVLNFESRGGQNDAIQFSATLESSGAVAFA